MDSLILILVIVFAGILFIPHLARLAGIPVIVFEIVFGIVIGKSLLNLVPDNSAIEFFSSFGLIYLMFLAGMETDFARITANTLGRSAVIALGSIALPFVVGFLIGNWAGIYPPLLGTIFSTTSIGLTLPMLKELNFSPRFGRLLLTSVVLVDVISLFTLAFVLNAVDGSIRIGFIYSFILILLLFLLPLLLRINKVSEYRSKVVNLLEKQSYFETEVRLAFAMIFFLAAMSSQLGFHSIIGAFLAGQLVSEVMPQKILKEERLQSFGYGFFIPMFFIFTGAKVNLPAVFSNLDNIAVLIVVIIGGMLAKVVGVFTVAIISGNTFRESLGLGVFHSARLSLIVAAAGIALSLNLVQDNMFAILIILAVISATFAPVVGKRIMSPLISGIKP